jgi:hypothetical protein
MRPLGVDQVHAQVAQVKHLETECNPGYQASARRERLQPVRRIFFAVITQSVQDLVFQSESNFPVPTRGAEIELLLAAAEQAGQDSDHFSEIRLP